jgi:poly(3-hydroxybutyrate) depolymerase
MTKHSIAFKVFALTSILAGTACAAGLLAQAPKPQPPAPAAVRAVETAPVPVTPAEAGAAAEEERRQALRSADGC